MALITLSNICKAYPVGDGTIPILTDVSFTISEGDYVAIMGPSGSGKSTLMNILGALDQQYAGAYQLDQVDIRTLSTHRLSEIRRTRIGFVFQTFNLIAKLSALQNVELPMIYNRKPMNERLPHARHLLETVGLGHRLQHSPSQMSGGERQRVAIARALINDPKLILADEPTGNLDSKSGVQIMGILDSLNQSGKTIILVTHDREVAAHARQIIHILDGRIDQIEEVRHVH